MSFKQMQGGFFDRPKVKRAVDRATFSALKEIGRRVRKSAQKSIQIREGAAPPGHPPHGHKTLRRTRVSKSKGTTRTQSVSPLREFIYFAFEATPRPNVVIGPIKLNTKRGDALKALEHGGTSIITTHGKEVKATISPHPFMKPAMDRERENFPALWRNKVRG